MTTQTSEIDHAHEAHLRFMSRQRFDIGTEIVDFEGWVDWQCSRDPLDAPSQTIAKFRRRAENEMEAEREAARGPGIARRPRTAKTTGGRKDA